jgi:nucleoside-diphosphate-sugar epimerase
LDVPGDLTTARPTMIYGDPGDRNLSRLLPLLRSTPVRPVPGGRHLQQPVHAADVADAVLAAAKRPAADLGYAPRSFAGGIRAEARSMGLAA